MTATRDIISLLAAENGHDNIVVAQGQSGESAVHIDSSHLGSFHIPCYLPSFHCTRDLLMLPAMGGTFSQPITAGIPRDGDEEFQGICSVHDLPHGLQKRIDNEVLPVLLAQLMECPDGRRSVSTSQIVEPLQGRTL